jgi:hypothetical protein
MSKLLKIFILISVLISILIVGFSKTNLLLRLQCNFSQGYMTRTSLGEYCDFPPDDWKKICHEKSDCSYDCIYKGVGEDGYFYGECSKFSTICERTIPIKTNNVNDLSPEPRCVSN